MDPIFNRVLADAATGGRTSRARLISRIERSTGGRVLTYIAPLDFYGNALVPDDMTGIESALETIPPGADLDFVLNTPGGLGAAAAHIVTRLRDHCRTLRVWVPHAAKSAGTLIALGADEIYMGPPSQLGPIDPQVPWVNGMIPAHAIVDSYETFYDSVNQKGRIDPADVLVSQKFDLPLIDLARKSIAEAEETAYRFLRHSMLAAPDEDTWARETARRLAHNRQSHGLAISAREAQDTYHLRVTALDSSDPRWKLVWELYLRSDTFLRQSQHAKLIETRHASLSVLATPIPQPPSNSRTAAAASGAPAGHAESDIASTPPANAPHLPPRSDGPPESPPIAS
ncbi:MAG: hypothetical protein K6V97_04200 [Actinomycetia bacterium]|nr:hypothetical protein [Actinomycetes bacterium]